MILAFPIYNEHLCVGYRLADDPAFRNKETAAFKERLKAPGVRARWNGAEWTVNAPGYDQLRKDTVVPVTTMHRVRIAPTCHIPERWTWASELDVLRGAIGLQCPHCKSFYNAAQIMEVNLIWQRGVNGQWQLSLPL